MGRRPKVYEQQTDVQQFRPALTPEARENQLISLAFDLVETRLRNGTATSQETTHFLKLASQKYRLELEKTTTECDLAKAKTSALKSAENSEKLYENGLNAFKSYVIPREDPDDYSDLY